MVLQGVHEPFAANLQRVNRLAPHVMNSPVGGRMAGCPLGLGQP